MKKALYLFAALFLSGCARIPFEPVALSPVAGLDAAQVRNNFEMQSVNRFSVLESAAIRFRGREIIALGYSEVNEPEDTLAVAGVTPVGVKLFEVKVVKDDLKYSFSFPRLKNSKDPEEIAKAIAEDIRRIYLGRNPSVDAEVFKQQDRIGYRQAEGKGMLEFYFGGPESGLLEKRYVEGKREIWKVRYFEYLHKDSKIYPSKIFFENLQRKYKVTLRLKEVLA